MLAQHWLPLLILLIFISTIYSCSPTGMLATGGSTAMVVAEGDRSLGTFVDDDPKMKTAKKAGMEGREKERRKEGRTEGRKE